MLLQHLKTILIVLRRLLHPTPLIPHRLNTALQLPDLSLHLADSLPQLLLNPLLLLQLLLKLPAHAILVLEDILELLALETSGAELGGGASDVCVQGVFAL